MKTPMQTRSVHYFAFKSGYGQGFKDGFVASLIVCLVAVSIMAIFLP